MSGPKMPPALDGAPLISDWLRFGADREVEFRTGRVELGQGAVTAILQIAAGELGLDPHDVRIVSGDTSVTPDEGGTVGSLSIQMGGAAASWAASAARRVVLAEAARRLNVAQDDLTVENGAICDKGEPTGLDLRDVAAEIALDLPIATHGAPDLTGVSIHELDRIDLPARVLGAPFIHDLGGSDCLRGRVLHPPTLGGRLRSLDTDALAARSGIISVVRNGDAVGVVGESPAAVDAAIAWAAGAADWEMPEPEFGELRTYLKSIADGRGETVREAGNPEEGGAWDVSVTASRGYITHGSIGPAAAIAHWDNGKLTVDSPTQAVYPLREALAEAYALKPEQITVRHQPSAGCYGHNGFDDAAADAVFLAMAVPGRKVKVVWSREDEFRAAPLGAAMATRVSLKLRDGRVDAAEVSVASQPHSSRPGTSGAPCLATPSRFDPPVPFPVLSDVPTVRGGGADRNAPPYYAIPNMRIEKTMVHDLPYRASALRGLGAHLNVYAVEIAMDAAARAVGADPVAFRLDHLDDPRARAVIESVAKGGFPEPTETTAWGLGFGRYKNGAAYCAVAVELEMGERLAVRKARVALDTGRIISRDGVMNQTEGGLLQAISWTLFEEMPLHGAGAGAETWADYPILRFTDVPAEVTIDLIDRPDEPPMGCAEALQGPTAAAIGTAAAVLFGVPLPDLPLTPERIAASL